MKKILLFLFLVLFISIPSVGFTKTYDKSLKQPEFVISRSDWGADESIRFAKNYRTPTSTFTTAPNEYEKKYASELEVVDIIKNDPVTGQKLYWPISHSKEVRLFVVHHSATELPVGKEVDAIKAIYYWHSVVRGWGDIGYNYIIDNNGNVYEGRAGGLFVVAGHTSNYNTGSVGIMLLGNFSETVPTAPSLVSLKKLLISLADIYDVNLEGTVDFREKTGIPTVVGHREMGATACPGNNFFEYLAFFRQNEDFSKNLVSSTNNTIASEKVFYQVPAGSKFSFDYLGLSKPKKVLTINKGKMVVTNDFDTLNFSESDTLKILKYNDDGVRGNNILIEARKDFYGLSGFHNGTPTVDLGPGQSKIVTFDIQNNFFKSVNFNNWVESKENNSSILSSFLSSGGGISWLSNKLIQPFGTQKVAIEVRAPAKEGIYNSNLLIGMDGGNVLGGQKLDFKIRVSEDRRIAENVPYVIDPPEIEKKIVRTGNGTYTFEVPLTTYPAIGKAYWQVRVLDKKVGILGEDIPKGIRVFADYGKNGPYLRFMISRSVPDESYSFFATLNAAEGTFASKSVLVKLSFEEPYPAITIDELLNKISKIPGKEKQAISVSSTSENQLTIKNTGNVDFISGDLKVYKSVSSDCIADPKKTFVGSNTGTFRPGESLKISNVFGQVKKIEVRYLCYQSDLNKVSRDSIKAILSPYIPEVISVVTPKVEISAKVDNTKIQTAIAEPKIRILLTQLPVLQNLEVIADGLEYGVDNTKLNSNGKQVSVTKSNNLMNLTVGGKEYTGLKKIVFTSSDTVKISNMDRDYSWDTNNLYPDNEFRGNIEVYIGADGNFKFVNELPLESYIQGLAESGSTDKDEKIKSIVVAARSYAYFYIQEANRKYDPTDPVLKLIDGTYLKVDGSDDPAHFQKYVGVGFEKRFSRFVDNAKATAGEFLVYKNDVIKAPYFSSDTGKTKSAKEVWGWTNTPYLDSKNDPWCTGKSLSGHGVGMSGCGAQGQATEGKNYKEILGYYYPGVDVKKLY